jgi:hypothetical protein
MVAIAEAFVIAETAVPALIMQLLKVKAPVPELITAALFAFELLPLIVPLFTVSEDCPDKETPWGIAAWLFAENGLAVMFPFIVI